MAVKKQNLEQDIKELAEEIKESNDKEVKEVTKDEDNKVELNVATLSRVQKEVERIAYPTEKYPYVNEDGEIIYEVWKMKNSREPYYTMRPQANGQAKPGLSRNTKRIPYNLPNVIKAKKEGAVIIVTEGERKANIFNELGYVATCVIGKDTDKWKSKYNKYVKYTNVLIVADNDDKGRDFADIAFSEISEVANNVGILELKDLYPQLQEGGDIEDLRKIVNNDKYLKEVLDSVINDLLSNEEVEK